MNTFDCSDETEWDLAERAVATVGTPPSLFTAAIRAIRNAPSILQTADEAALSKFSVSAALFPVKVSPTLKASFYFAAEELFEQKLRAARPLTPARLLGLFHPDEVAAIITLTLLNRAIRGRCPADEWEKIVPRMNAHMMVGGVVGRSMKMVGFGNGLLMAGIRYLSLGTMIATAPKRYKELRRSMDVSTALFLPEVEQKVFGCTHLHIASTLVSAMGYGVVPRLALGIHGMACCTSRNGSAAHLGGAPRLYRSATRLAVSHWGACPATG
jgi:hypothetical protein